MMGGVWPKIDNSILIKYFIIYVGPLIVGVIFIVFSLSYGILSWKNKINRFYIKSVALRILISFIILAVFSFISISIILMLFGSNSTP